jgi:hypothetical protein
VEIRKIIISVKFNSYLFFHVTNSGLDVFDFMLM